MLIAERLTAQLLAGPPASDPVTVVERLLAVQGQDGRGVRLAIRARSTVLTGADVDRALSEERSLLITWLNRGTLHLVRREDYPWLHALTAPTLFASNARRLSQEGVTGPMIGGEHAYVLVRDWLGEVKPVDRDRSLAELARRYLAGHGPADERDLAKWAGLPLRDARAGLKAIASALDLRSDGLVDLAGRSTAAPLPPPRLLGAYEPLLMGWASRKPFVGSYQSLVTANGLFRPFALVRGRAAATWSFRAGDVAFEPFCQLSRKDVSALEREAKDVARFLGAT